MSTNLPRNDDEAVTSGQVAKHSGQVAKHSNAWSALAKLENDDVHSP